MPLFEFEIKDGVNAGLRFERLLYGTPPDFYFVEGGTGVRVPTCAAFKIKDGTEKFFKDTGQRVIEPGTNRDTARNKRYREEQEDRDRKKDLGTIFSDVMDEATAASST